MSDEGDWLNPTAPADSPLAVIPVVPETAAARDAKLVAVFSALTPKQRTLLQALQLNYFNFNKTNKLLAATSDHVDRKTYYMWRRNDNAFAYALMILKAQAVEALDTNRTLLRVAEIAEDALDPKPVYFKGEPTGEMRTDYTAALKATELQMRNKKLLGEDKEAGGFGGRQITLAVQIVMPTGEVKEATRKGVIIDVPVIELPS